MVAKRLLQVAGVLQITLAVDADEAFPIVAAPEPHRQVIAVASPGTAAIAFPNRVRRVNSLPPAHRQRLTAGFGTDHGTRMGGLRCRVARSARHTTSEVALSAAPGSVQASLLRVGEARVTGGANTCQA